jgi:hypothetical protein
MFFSQLPCLTELFSKKDEEDFGIAIALSAKYISVGTSDQKFCYTILYKRIFAI